MFYFFGKVRRIHWFNSKIVNWKQSFFRKLLSFLQDYSTRNWKSTTNYKQICYCSSNFKRFQCLFSVLRMLQQNVNHFQCLLHKLAFSNTSYEKSLKSDTFMNISHLIFFIIYLIFIKLSKMYFRRRSWMQSSLMIDMTLTVVLYYLQYQCCSHFEYSCFSCSSTLFNRFLLNLLTWLV